ncbi:MAG: hypothetical protein ACI88H_004223 [Cocleimonas sp.]|jgi:hypothetical protein
MNLNVVKDRLLLLIAGIVCVAFAFGFFSIAGEHVMTIFLLFICLLMYNDRKEIKKLRTEIEELKNKSPDDQD